MKGYPNGDKAKMRGGHSQGHIDMIPFAKGVFLYRPFY